MRIVQFTDTHLIPTKNGKLYGIDTYASLRLAFTKAMDLAQRPDAVFVTGDLTEDGARETYLRFKEIFEDSKLPVFVTPGNHDSIEVMKEVFAEGNIKVAFHAVFGEWVGIFLNSQAAGKAHGVITGDDMSAMEKVLSSAKGKSAVISFHHPPGSSCPAAGCKLKNADELAEFLRPYPEVKLILAGHLHMDVDQEYGNLRVLTSPSTFAQCVHPHVEQNANLEDFWASHRLDHSRQGFRIVDFFSSGIFSTELCWF